MLLTGVMTNKLLRPAPPRTATVIAARSRPTSAAALLLASLLSAPLVIVAVVQAIL